MHSSYKLFVYTVYKL